MQSVWRAIYAAPAAFSAATDELSGLQKAGEARLVHL
jgi:hypothetical protein